jgi:YD repeat-containing protein
LYNVYIRKILENINNIDYNQRNLPKGRVYANNLATNFTYDIKNFRLKKITTGSKQNINYIYDNVGNVKNINDTINLRKETMLYDALDRLTSSLRTDNNVKKYYHNFTYNSIGNMLNITKDADEDWLFFYNGSRPMHMPYRVALR